MSAPPSCQLDLIGVLMGSEGTLAIVTKVWVRLTPNPQDYRAMRAIFNSVDDASNAVSQIIAAGIIPAAMELMDQGILAAVEEAYQFGFPPDAGAVLVIEVDGPGGGLDRQQEQIVEFCRRFGAREVLQASSAQERELLWKCRKMAVGATGRLSPSYTIQDGVVPRTRLPHIIRRTAEIGQKHQIRIVNVAHAGDGNIHPILLFDERNRDEVDGPWPPAARSWRNASPRRQHYRRARHRHGKDRPDGPAFRPRRSGGHAPCSPRRSIPRGGSIRES